MLCPRCFDKKSIFTSDLSSTYITSRASTLSSSAAQKRAVLSFLSTSYRRAPFCKSVFMVAAWPLLAAISSGLKLSLSRRFIRAPLNKNNNNLLASNFEVHQFSLSANFKISYFKPTSMNECSLCCHKSEPTSVLGRRR